MATLAGCGRQPEPSNSQFETRPGNRKVEADATQNSGVDLSENRQSTERLSDQARNDRGLRYQNDRFPEVPWSVNLLRVDRSHTEFQLTTTLGGRRQTMGLGRLSEQIEAIPGELGEAVAAINGDFYRTEQEPYAGDPRGLQIMHGELISAPSGKTCFWVDTDGNPNIGNVASNFRITWPNGESTPFGLNEERHSNDAVLYTARVGRSTGASGGREFVLVLDGDNGGRILRPGQTYRAQVREVREGGNTRLSPEIMVLSIGPILAGKLGAIKAGTSIQISTATTPDLNGVQIALGGGPPLVHSGKVQPANANKSRERHPRSAFGWNDQFFYLVEVDGRQHGFSVGMTLPELASYMQKQGCQEAFDLDGGGSSELWIEGRIVNRPCFGRERETANGLVVLRKAKLESQQKSEP